jgi:nucleoside-diphosphate-sugar epimerase
MSRLLLTGATGFVGSVLSGTLAEAGHVVRAAVRSDGPLPRGCAEQVVVGDIGPDTNWEAALRDVDQVVHAAARAHVPGDGPANSELYKQTNARGTQRLAGAAAAAGVTRFIFLSTVKVNGEGTAGHAYAPADEPRPQNGYAMSKWAAERHLTQLAATSAMQAVIVRAPLVYGPGVRANFLRLMQWIDKGWPLPFRSVHNTRSLVSVWNLCDLLANLTRNPAAPGRTWMVSDGEDLSTPQLIARLGRGLGRPVRLLPVPVGVLRLCGAALRRQHEIGRLCDSLVVDMSLTHTALGWSAPVGVDEALARTAAWYLSECR